MLAANDLARLCICTVSPESSLIASKKWDIDEGSGQIVYLGETIRKNDTYLIYAYSYSLNEHA